MRQARSDRGGSRCGSEWRGRAAFWLCYCRREGLMAVFGGGWFRKPARGGAEILRKQKSELASCGAEA